MMVRVQGVSHAFGRAKVLDDVWFDVPRGEVLGFIGPNGAGKTTTPRIPATLLEPDSGRVLVDGYDVVERPLEVRRRLGYLPDGFGVYERLSVIEDLELFAGLTGVPVSQRARTIAAVMELTDVGPLRDHLVAGLSKGQRQRLGIARMLLHDPSLVVLDEPANGLDPRARIEFRDLVAQLASMGKTVVLSSHILTELSDMVSTVVILEAGRVVAHGRPESLRSAIRTRMITRVRLHALPVDLSERLLDLPGAESVERGPDGDLRIAHASGDAVIAGIVRALVERDLAVVRVVPERDDLEQVFLELTRGGGS